MSKKTPLYEKHEQLGALIVDFAGWLMPLHYGSQLNEHHQVRQDVGVFDVSHMTVIDVKGNEAKSFLRYLVANDVNKIQINQALYTCMLNEAGGVKDDLIIYYLADNHYRLVVNASTREKDYNWICEKSTAFDVTIHLREDLCILAIQGPQAWEKVSAVFSPKQNQVTQGLKPFHVVTCDEWVIAHTGYTGESGMEIILPQIDAVEFWQRLINADIKPAGLGARDSLRLEAGLNLYGQDMDETTSPLESNLGWTVDFKDEKRDFIGKGALLKQLAQGLKQQLQGIVLLDKGVCRAGMLLESDHGGQGILTSGGFSPTLNCGIGLARVELDKSTHVKIDIRSKKVNAKIIKPPFVKKGKANFV